MSSYGRVASSFRAASGGTSPARTRSSSKSRRSGLTTGHHYPSRCASSNGGGSARRALRRLAVREKTGEGCSAVVSAPLIGFTLGVLFAWLARDDIARGSPGSLSSRSLSIVALYTFFVFAPACACFVVLE